MKAAHDTQVISANVTGRILSFVGERRLEPGDRLPSERELAERFGVSRAALRESLATLEAMRVIERRPNSGIYLARRDAPPSFESLVLRSDLGLPVDASTIMQSMEVRNVLELHAIELACARRTDEDIGQLGEILEQTRRLLDTRQSIIDLDESFHLAIVAATHNNVFAQIVHAFYRLSRLRREIYFSDLKRCQRSYREHRAILHAIQARDAGRGAQLMRRHIHEGFWRSALKVSQPA